MELVNLKLELTPIRMRMVKPRLAMIIHGAFALS